MHTILVVAVEWDGRKAEANLRKHGVGFAEAVTLFDDPHAITSDDDSGVELRHVVIGRDALHRILVVVYTWRGARVRVISARIATAQERRAYREGL